MFLPLPKLKIVDHDIGQRSQDFGVSEVQCPSHIPIDLEKSWICSFVQAELFVGLSLFRIHLGIC